MLEIEVKILEINVPKVIRMLENMGASRTFGGDQVSRFYDFPDGRMEKQGKFIRLRDRGDQTEFTLKKNITKDRAKSADEIKCMADEGESLSAILNDIGMIEKYSLKKHRISYRYEDAYFEIDTYQGIPPWLEIEAPDEERVRHFVERLGFRTEDTRPWSIRDVLAHYRKKSS